MKTHIQLYKYILPIIPFAALLFTLLFVIPHTSKNATAAVAEQILAAQFPHHDKAPLSTMQGKLSTLLFGFNPHAPHTLLANQFPFIPFAPNVNTPTTPSAPKLSTSPSTNSPTSENTLPIVESTQTTSALQNTDGTNKYIYVDNDTSYTPQIATLLQSPLQFTLSDTEPTVLIVHTHTTESYTPEGQTSYSPTQSTRTQDKSQNVVRIGEEIADTLTAHGIHVLHDTTINDYPSFNDAYGKTLTVIESYLQRYPSIRVVLDVHRDGITKSDGTKLKLTADVGGKKAAQLMLVIGTNEGGLTHDAWEENLKLGLHIQDQLTTMYPNIARPLNLRKERFNQHVTTGSMIVEVGSDGNTLSEALLAGRCFANALAAVLNA